MHKFPRTPHIRGSRKQHGDHDLESVPWSELHGKHLVVEEKCDGANCGISFSDKGELLLQSRGHYLRGGPREKQFGLLKQWATARQDELFGVLGTQYIMYGEWLWCKHTYFYDALPHYFMEFDVLDTKDNVFLSTEARAQLLKGVAVTPVLVLKQSKFDRLSDLSSLITTSHFTTLQRVPNFLNACSAAGILPKDAAFGNKEIQEAMATCDWSPLMEGLYVKWEEDGIVKGRYKFVRDSFTNSIIDQDTHWHDRPIVQNKLKEGALEAMFQ
jgi:hypothetical protein